MPQGRNYINKLYFHLDEGWTVDAVNAKIEEMGLRPQGGQTVLRSDAFDKYSTRPGFNLMIYTHNTKDDPSEFRRSFVNTADSQWYFDRGWEPIPVGKMEIPY